MCIIYTVYYHSHSEYMKFYSYIFLNCISDKVIKNYPPIVPCMSHRSMSLALQNIQLENCVLANSSIASVCALTCEEYN